MPGRWMHSAAVVFLLAFIPTNSSISGDASTPAAQTKHGLTGSYYVSTLETHTDVNPTGQDWYVQVWRDPNDFRLPRPFTAPAAVRVDPQIAFGQGKGFVMQNGQRTAWWPTDFANPASWHHHDPTAKPWEYLAAVIWKGYIRLPKAGTYYLTTASKGASAVYLNQARVALNGTYGGVLVSDAFTYAKEDLRDYLQNLAYGREDLLFKAQPGAWSLSPSYVVPVTVETPRDVPIEVRHSIEGTLKRQPTGIDLFWVTPDSPRDASGKPVAQIVPSEALYVDAPGPIEKPAVRGANSMISADFLYFPAERTDKDVTVTVRLRDKDGYPVAGKRVHVGSLVSYGGADAIKQPDKLTDEKGETTAGIHPGEGYKVTHESTIFATDVTDLVDVAQVARVTFQAGTVPTSFFADNAFSPYFAPEIIRVEPEPLVVGRPVTVSVALENRGKYPVELAATFRASDWAIGPEFKNEIGRREHIQLKPGEARRASVQWTPGKAQTHQCFEVVLTGRVLFGANRIGTRVVTAELLPTTNVVNAAPPEGSSVRQRTQTNRGPVKPPPPCPEDLTPIAGPVPGAWGIPQTGPDTVWVERDRMWQPFMLCTPSRKWKNYGKKWSKTYNDERKHDCSRAAADAIFGQEISVEKLKNYNACEKLKEMAEAADTIARHPPDPTYRLAVARADTPAAYLDAWRVSWERYDAALAQGDKEWMAKQATAIHLYMQDLAAALRRDADVMQKEADKLRPDDSNTIAQLQAEQQRLKDWLQRGAPLTPDQLKPLQAAGFTEQQAKDTASLLLAEKDTVVLKSDRALALETSALYRQAADEMDNLDASPTAPEVGVQPGQALIQTYTVGNPHDKQETVDLFIRPISIPPDWKASILNAEQRQSNPQTAKPGGDPPEFPLREIEAGKHYAVTLPAKGQMKVASSLIPLGEVGANTTARWAVEGKIGNELIGGMVHEMNVPYIIADLKLPPVGSKEEEETQPQAVQRIPWAVIVGVSAGVLILLVLAFLILKRRRRTRAAR